ncbi:hypothetical protein LFREDSHE_41990 [Shewanella baltica]
MEQSSAKVVDTQMTQRQKPALGWLWELRSDDGLDIVHPNRAVDQTLLLSFLYSDQVG